VPLELRPITIEPPSNSILRSKSCIDFTQQNDTSESIDIHHFAYPSYALWQTKNAIQICKLEMMSTKATLSHGDHFHFYLEVFDDANVYLELDHTEFKVNQRSVMVRIPMDVWVSMHAVGVPKFDLAIKTDTELLEMVTAEVVERRAKYRNAKDKRARAWVSLIGCLVYGLASDSKAKQIETGLAFFRAKRDQQQSIVEQATQHKRSRILSSEHLEP
jgi:hypothetical protein